MLLMLQQILGVMKIHGRLQMQTETFLHLELLKVVL